MSFAPHCGHFLLCKRFSWEHWKEIKRNQKKASSIYDNCPRIAGINCFFLMTDIINESTELLMVGEMCKEVIENAFETTVEDSSAELPGVVSRKKQLIPAILGQLS